MEEDIKALQKILSDRQFKIDEHDKELAELRVQLAILSTKQDEILGKLDRFVSTYTWAARIVGAAFLVSVWSWITGGGFNR